MAPIVGAWRPPVNAGPYRLALLLTDDAPAAKLVQEADGRILWKADDSVTGLA
jgi:hypothetical protein